MNEKRIYFIMNAESSCFHVRYTLREATRKAKSLCEQDNNDWTVVRVVRNIQKQNGRVCVFPTKGE